MNDQQFPNDNADHSPPVAEPLLLANLTSPRTGQALETLDLVLIPIGAHEQHGPALPVSTDALTAQVLCALTASLVQNRIGVLPVVPWGVSWHHQGRPGTVSLREETLIALLLDQIDSLYRQGIKRIMLVNTHGGNNPALAIAAERAKREFGVPLVTSVYAYALLANAARDVLGDEAIGHGGGDEASAVLAIRPDLVDREKLGAQDVNNDIRRVQKIVDAVGGTLPVMMHRRTKSGATGDSSHASEDAGNAILGQAAAQLRAICEEILDLDLDLVS